MAWWLLLLTVNILASLRLTVNLDGSIYPRGHPIPTITGGEAPIGDL